MRAPPCFDICQLQIKQKIKIDTDKMKSVVCKLVGVLLFYSMTISILKYLENQLFTRSQEAASSFHLYNIIINKRKILKTTSVADISFHNQAQ